MAMRFCVKHFPPSSLSRLRHTEEMWLRVFRAKQPDSRLVLNAILSLHKGRSSAGSYHETSGTVTRSAYVCRADMRYFSTKSDRVPFLLADIGEGIKEVELLQWYVQQGDDIQQFDKVCEVQSDKATVEITSRFDGQVAELAGEVGDMMQVGSPLLYLHGKGRAAADSDADSADDSDSGEDTKSSSGRLQDTDSIDYYDRLHIPTVASHYHLQSDHDAAEQRQGKYLASPAVRKLGKEYKLNLSTIHGSGPRGRLLKHDVVTYLHEQGVTSAPEKTNLAAQQHVATARGSIPTSANVTAASKTAPENRTTSAASTIPLTPATHDEILKLKGYHRLMIQSMTAALQIPHMCFADELNVSRLVECRKQLKEAGTVVSYLAFLLKACSLALLEYPTVNASIHNLEAGELLIKHSHDMGVAMNTARGLVVPVIRGVQVRSLLEVQAELDRLKLAAADSKLAAADLAAPSFTLSNIGSMGGTYMQPVIVPPQLAMGALGQMHKVPRFDADDQVVAAHVLHVSWAGDHRVLDGATLARFSAKVKEYTENPVHMLTHLR